MFQSSGLKKRNISISIDNVEDIILPRLKTLSPAQWTLLSQEMANVLQVSPEMCHSGKELNSLMEEEVSQKVTSIANVIRRTPVYPVEPAVYSQIKLC
ncbi:hypothetical protein ATANTOWER_031093 [Ataeniobius toweri]|uniref:Uncharacterized protein n=1 Tax=Ataeniobius toweri TaxID=208326 RepID=A0ABU7BAX1_9TELE|nr:hypothetical protein [Ataeniobius toweri]